MSNKYDYLKFEEPTFLEEADVVGYVCPCCGNGCSGNHKPYEESSGDGIVRIPDSGRWKCFKCGFVGSTVDLWMEVHDVHNFTTACHQLEKYYGTHGYDLDKNKTHIMPISELTKKIKVELPDFYENDFYVKALEHPDSYKYLKSRGISEYIQSCYLVGFVPDWKPSKCPNAPPTAKCIIPRSSSCYLARSVDENANPKYQKQVEGVMQEPFGWNEMNLDSVKNIFVTEGEIDAMSIMEILLDNDRDDINLDNTAASALCSIANTKKYISYISSKENLKDKRYILLLDNDQPGKETQSKMFHEMRDKGFNVIGYAYPKDCPYKDPNSFLMGDRDGFEKYIISAAIYAERTLPSLEQIDKTIERL